MIQQLKQQKHELQSLQVAERRRAKTSENISAAVLSNLSSGVLFFTPNGLVRQANASAKQILGFASPTGMSAAEIFREAELISVIPNALTRTWPKRSTPACGRRPGFSGWKRAIARPRARNARWILRSVRCMRRTAKLRARLAWALLSGRCLLINDRTEVTEIRRQQELRGEMSAEMALGLRNSLTTIAGYAQQLAASRDPELARQLAADIAAEAAHLDRTIGGFLASAKAREGRFESLN